MDSLEEIKQSGKLNINSEEISEEIDDYFDNISKEQLIEDLEGVDIEVGELDD